MNCYTFLNCAHFRWLQKHDAFFVLKTPEKHFHRSRNRPTPTASATLADYLPSGALSTMTSSSSAAAQLPSSVPSHVAAVAKNSSVAVERLLDDDLSPPLVATAPIPPAATTAMAQRASYANVLGDKSPNRSSFEASRQQTAAAIAATEALKIQLKIPFSSHSSFLHSEQGRYLPNFFSVIRKSFFLYVLKKVAKLF